MGEGKQMSSFNYFFVIYRGKWSLFGLWTADATPNWSELFFFLSCSSEIARLLCPHNVRRVLVPPGACNLWRLYPVTGGDQRVFGLYGHDSSQDHVVLHLNSPPPPSVFLSSHRPLPPTWGICGNGNSKFLVPPKLFFDRVKPTTKKGVISQNVAKGVWDCVIAACIFSAVDSGASGWKVENEVWTNSEDKHQEAMREDKPSREEKRQWWFFLTYPPHCWQNIFNWLWLTMK